MDNFQLGQVFGCAALTIRVGSQYLQSRFPDSHRIRKAMVPSHAVSALSYAFNGNPVAATSYGMAALRSGSFLTRLGSAHKKLVSTINLGVVSTVTAAFYENTIDALALGGTIAANIADYQAQGRYQRLAYFFGRAGLWIPMAGLSHNWSMLGADIASLGFTCHGMYEHDIKNAAGPDQPLHQNMLAYLHGILRNSATSADIKGQTSTDPGSTESYEAYKIKCKDRPNPFVMAHPVHFAPKSL